jgi:hypothetical protein
MRDELPAADHPADCSSRDAELRRDLLHREKRDLDNASGARFIVLIPDRRARLRLSEKGIGRRRRAGIPVATRRVSAGRRQGTSLST